MTVLTKLIQIQQELKAPKNLNNSFGGYKYRSNESILEALKPILAKQNCVLIQTDDYVMNGDRFHIKATSTLISVEDSTEVSCSGFAREAVNKKGMDDSQFTGATSSYARKYSLNGLFLIDDNKDADTDNYSKQEFSLYDSAWELFEQKKASLTPEQANWAADLLKKKQYEVVIDKLKGL